MYAVIRHYHFQPGDGAKIDQLVKSPSVLGHILHPRPDSRMLVVVKGEEYKGFFLFIPMACKGQHAVAQTEEVSFGKGFRIRRIRKVIFLCRQQ